MRHGKAGQTAVVTLVVVALAAVTVIVHHQTNNVILLAYWWLGALVLATCLISYVIGRRYTHLAPATGKVLAIIPAYNETEEALAKTVRALLNQTRPPDKIVVIDDGSAVAVRGFPHPRVEWRRQDNTGKRGAQVAVLRTIGRHDYQFVLTVDSDSEPYPDAVEQLLRAMANPSVEAATGMIYIRNYDESLVSLAADIDIGTSCVMMRASRSMLGALETTSGALAIYRSALLYDHLAEYAIECGTGDDRWLALRALRRGEVVAVAEAKVATDMPTTIKGTRKQRQRWGRSWWWMMPYALINLRPKQLISPLYGLTQLAITPIMLGWIVVTTILTLGRRFDHPQLMAIYVGGYVVVRFACSGLYLMERSEIRTWTRLRMWLVGTVAAILLNVFVLIPLRYYVLFRLGDNRWQTRDLATPAPNTDEPPTRHLLPVPHQPTRLVTAVDHVAEQTRILPAVGTLPKHAKA